MVKILLRTALLCLIGLTIVISSVTAFHPKELYRDQVAVIMYHHIHDTDTSSGTITTKMFHDQLAYLRSKGYHFIHLDELRRFLQGAPVPNNAVLVTFDDGYESFYTNAYPILKEMKIPATNFIITKDLDDPHGSYIPSMSRDQISTMLKDSNLIDIGCHTHELHGKSEDGKALLTNRVMINGQLENDSDYQKRVSSDTAMCISRVKELIGSSKADDMAYPFGIFNEKAAEIIHNQGIQYAFTILPKMTTRNTDPMSIPRINAGSPYMTPEYLNNMIMRRVVSVDHPFDNVVLRDTMEQIGGELAVDKDGYLLLSYNGDQWKVLPNSDEVIHNRGNGEKIKLSKPITVHGNRTLIRLDDLQLIIGAPITIDPATGTFTTKLPTSSEVDTETIRHAPIGK